MSPPRGATNGAPRPPEGRQAQESWWPGDGSAASFAPQYPEAQAGLDVKPSQGREGRRRDQSARQDEREHALEG
jgi:hypothetical protein